MRAWQPQLASGKKPTTRFYRYKKIRPARPWLFSLTVAKSFLPGLLCCLRVWNITIESGLAYVTLVQAITEYTAALQKGLESVTCFGNAA